MSNFTSTDNLTISEAFQVMEIFLKEYFKGCNFQGINLILNDLQNPEAYNNEDSPIWKNWARCVHKIVNDTGSLNHLTSLEAYASMQEFFETYYAITSAGLKGSLEAQMHEDIGDMLSGMTLKTPDNPIAQQLMIPDGSSVDPAASAIWDKCFDEFFRKNSFNNEKKVILYEQFKKIVVSAPDEEVKKLLAQFEEKDFLVAPLVLDLIVNKRFGILGYLYKENIPFDYTYPSGTNALHIACRIGSLHGVKFLIENNIINDIDAPNNRRETPFYLAVMHNHTNIAEYLLRKGCPDITVSTIYGETPIDWAERWENTEMLQLLKEAESKRIS